ncbi:MAG: hypothetical protein V1804_04985, partial [Patescibacteria group bacterium]
MKNTKKLKLLMFILAGCFGFFLSVHAVLSAGCCFIQYNVSQGSCEKNVTDSTACNKLTGGNAKYKAIFYNNDPNCAGSSIAAICARASQSTTPVQQGTPTASDPVGCCSKSITGGGYASCVQSVNKSNCSSFGDQFWSGDPTCQSNQAQGWCSANDRGCCASSPNSGVGKTTCAKNVNSINCKSAGQYFISGDIDCSGKASQGTCNSESTAGNTAKPSNIPGPTTAVPTSINFT